MGNTGGGIRIGSSKTTVPERWRKVAFLVLRRLRSDCLSESKIENDNKGNTSTLLGLKYINNVNMDKHLQYWCDVAQVSKAGFIRRLRRDIEKVNK